MDYLNELNELIDRTRDIVVVGAAAGGGPTTTTFVAAVAAVVLVVLACALTKKLKSKEPSSQPQPIRTTYRRPRGDTLGRDPTAHSWTRAQKAALVEMRRRLQNDSNEYLSHCDDATILRFCDGHEFNFKKVEEFMRKAARWRMEFDVDAKCLAWRNDSSNEAKLLKAWWPWGDSGVDAEGRPVLVLRWVFIDFARLISECSMELIVQMHVERFERISKQTMLGEAVLICDFNVILDKTLPIHHLTFPKERSLFREWVPALIKYMKAMTAVMEAYPELFNKIVFTRTPPRIFDQIWGIVKHFIPERTRKKIHNLSKDPDPTEKLVEIGIPKECVPTMYPSGEFETEDGTIPRGGCLPKNALESGDESLFVPVPARRRAESIAEANAKAGYV